MKYKKKYMTSPKAEEQAIPEMMRFIFETAKGASYNCEVFFDWDKLHTILEKSKNIKFWNIEDDKN